MGWELRNGKRYYYRKFRKGRQVISEYVGKSEVVEFLFMSDEADRNEKTRSRIAWKRHKDEAKRLHEGVSQLAKIITGLTRASLLTSGYHSHKGQWRKNRNGQRGS